MTLKKSSVNTFAFTFRKTLRNAIWVPLGLLIMNSYLILSDIVSFIVNYKKHLNHDPVYAAKMIEETVHKLSLGGSGSMLQMLWSALIIIGSVATAAVVFRFMMNKSAVNVWYSLGITKTKLFLSKYLAGALLLTVSSVLPFVISLILNIAIFGSSKGLWLCASFMSLSFWTLTMISYGIASATFCGVGTTLEGVFFSLVYCVAPSIAEMFVEVCYSNFLYGSPVASESWSNMGQVLVLGSGYHTFLFKDLGIFDFTFFPASANYANSASMKFNKELFDINRFTAPIIGILIFIVVSAIAVKVHSKRKNEITGFLGSNPLATGVVVFTSAMLFNSFLMLYIVDVDVKNYFLLSLIAILVFAVIYIVADIISLRNFKMIIKKLWKFPIHIGIFFAVILLFSSGLFGYSSRIPDLANIKSVSISTNTADTFVDFQNITGGSRSYFTDTEHIDEFLAVGNNLCSVAGNFTDRIDIEKIVSIHEQLIECKKFDVNSEKAVAPYNERVVPVNIAVIYNLKDGRTFERVYYAATENILCQLANLTLTEHYKSLATESLENGRNINSMAIENLSYKVSVVSPNMSNITAIPDSISKEATLSLLLAVSDDIKNDRLHLNFRNESDILGYIRISLDQEYYVTYHPDAFAEDIIAAQTYLDDKIVEEPQKQYIPKPYNVNKVSDSFSMAGRGLTIPVYSNMTSTIAMADRYGFTAYFDDIAKPVEAKIWKLDEKAVSEYIWRYQQMTSLTTGLWSNGKLSSENEAARGEVIEDAESWDSFNIIPHLPDTAKIIKDKSEIEKLEKDARLLALTCYDGEYVQFIFEDGSMTFGYIPS